MGERWYNFVFEVGVGVVIMFSVLKTNVNKTNSNFCNDVKVYNFI